MKQYQFYVEASFHTRKPLDTVLVNVSGVKNLREAQFRASAMLPEIIKRWWPAEYIKKIELFVFQEVI